MSKLRPYITPILVTILLSVMSIQLFVSAQTDSATADEPIHLLSGYATLTQHHLLFDPEHPFLIKAFAAVPLLWMHPQMPSEALHLDAKALDIDHNTYFEANQWGWQLIFEGSDNPYQVLLAARTMMILVTLGMALILFWWTKQLFGTVAALTTLALFSFDPNIIAHGKFINTDIGASLFFIGTLASYWKFLNILNYRWLVITGVVLGFGMLTKFSLGMLALILPLLMIAWLYLNRQNLMKMKFKPFSYIVTKININQRVRIWLQHCMAVASIGLIALSIIWLGYGTLMVVNPDQNPDQRPDILEPGNTLLSVLPPTYAKGIANIVAPNRQGYILGQCFEGSRWDYFPLLSLFKTPLPSLLLIAIGISLFTWTRMRKSLPVLPATGYFIIIPAIIYLTISGLTGINIGIRHVFPIYILLLIVAGYAASKIFSVGLKYHRSYVAIAICILLIGSVALSSFMAWPYYLPYYNLLSREPQNIPFVGDDSNTDWGQGAKALAKYVEEQNIKSIAFDNFINRTEIDYLKVPYVLADANDHNYKGYLAISRSTITNHLCQRQNDWGWVIDHHQPIAILAGAINIYYLD